MNQEEKREEKLNQEWIKFIMDNLYNEDNANIINEYFLKKKL